LKQNIYFFILSMNLFYINVLIAAFFLGTIFKMKKENCRKKMNFMNEQSALDHLAFIQERGKKFSRNVNIKRAYKCPKCGFWHLTRKP
jgi:hypothetical protein